MRGSFMEELNSTGSEGEIIIAAGRTILCTTAKSTFATGEEILKVKRELFYSAYLIEKRHPLWCSQQLLKPQQSAQPHIWIWIMCLRSF
ncbi:hypothetical protein PanWU01x14_289600 [Parasponia andersonii]|uniref:Uncharacterized protein n=1 Tax=Parasponia andersonii TaxID=3476 RepID=A0A2P5AY50_PARAD|nr:hypothetical protein PanWU01x14_289600 [Parasponia andersonii]